MKVKLKKDIYVPTVCKLTKGTEFEVTRKVKGYVYVNVDNLNWRIANKDVEIIK